MDDTMRRSSTVAIRNAMSIDQSEQYLRNFEREVLDAYKARVLEAALECQETENWCDEGLHTALRRLDIEPPKREYEVQVEVKAYQTVTVRVEAATEDEAMEKANGMLWGEVMERAAGGTWHHDAHEAEEAWVA